MKITICGSMVFYKEMQEAQRELEAQGHEVRIPLLDNELPPEYGGGRAIAFGDYIEKNGGIENFPAASELWGFKANAIRDHFSKVEWSDAIVVINHTKRGVAGYIGGNTLMEMSLAFYLRKPVYLLNDVSPDLLYKQEVMGMQPILLEGDLHTLAGAVQLAG